MGPMKITDLVDQVKKKLTEDERSFLALRATFTAADEGRLLWTLSASEGDFNARWEPILDVITDRDFVVLQAGPSEMLDWARWAAFHVTAGAIEPVPA